MKYLYTANTPTANISAYTNIAVEEVIIATTSNPASKLPKRKTTNAAALPTSIVIKVNGAW